MKDPLKKYEAYARSVKRLLIFVGLTPDCTFSNYYQIYMIAHTTTAIVTNSAILNFVASHATNLGLVTKGLGISLSYFTMLLKVTVFTVNRRTLVELHETLEGTLRRDLSNPELRSTALSPLKYFSGPTRWLVASTWGIVLIYFLTPPIAAIVQLSRGSTSPEYRLPFPTRYPWDATASSALYFSHYFMEVFAGFALAGVTAATDALFGFYVFQMSAQCRCLARRMADLRSSEDRPRVVRECALRHRILDRCRSSLERIYGPIILWMLMTSAINICAQIFQISQISIDKAVLVIVFIVMKLMQTLLYGWYGLFLTTESEAFRQSVYRSDWPGSGDTPFMKNILIMLMYKPLVLKACHFSVISLDMFGVIMNTALSYFFLLRTLDEKK